MNYVVYQIVYCWVFHQIPVLTHISFLFSQTKHHVNSTYVMQMMCAVFNCSTNHAYACKGCHAGLSILNHQWYVVDVIIIIWLFKAILVDWLLHSGNYLWLSHHQCKAVHGFPYHCDHMIFHAFSHPVHFNTQNLVCCDKYLIACISIYYCEKKSEKKTDTKKGGENTKRLQ